MAVLGVLRWVAVGHFLVADVHIKRYLVAALLHCLMVLTIVPIIVFKL